MVKRYDREKSRDGGSSCGSRDIWKSNDIVTKPLWAILCEVLPKIPFQGVVSASKIASKEILTEAHSSLSQ